jgi:hypothetical protein
MRRGKANCKRYQKITVDKPYVTDCRNIERNCCADFDLEPTIGLEPMTC